MLSSGCTSKVPFAGSGTQQAGLAGARMCTPTIVAIAGHYTLQTLGRKLLLTLLTSLAGAMGQSRPSRAPAAALAAAALISTLPLSLTTVPSITECDCCTSRTCTKDEQDAPPDYMCKTFKVRRPGPALPRWLRVLAHVGRRGLVVEEGVGFFAGSCGSGKALQDPPPPPQLTRCPPTHHPRAERDGRVHRQPDASDDRRQREPWDGGWPGRELAWRRRRCGLGLPAGLGGRPGVDRPAAVGDLAMGQRALPVERQRDGVQRRPAELRKRHAHQLGGANSSAPAPTAVIALQLRVGGWAPPMACVARG